MKPATTFHLKILLKKLSARLGINEGSGSLPCGKDSRVVRSVASQRLFSDPLIYSFLFFFKLADEASLRTSSWVRSKSHEATSKIDVVDSVRSEHRMCEVHLTRSAIWFFFSLPIEVKFLNPFKLSVVCKMQMKNLLITDHHATSLFWSY